MKNIKYQVELFSDWHCGSGQTAGADVDSLVVKDKNKLPFIPGKTIKGLVREAIEELISLKDLSNLIETVNQTFGFFDGKPLEELEEEDKQKSMIRGELFFTNAELSQNLREAIISSKTQEFLYRAVSSTAIDENGVAKEHSLRRIETVIPCVLYGEILNINDTIESELKDALLFIKQLGLNRNRGLGRCQFSVINKKEDSK